MPVFTFNGTTATGQKISGERAAENKQVLSAALRRERIVPGAIKEKGKEFALPSLRRSKVPTKDIAIFYRQFSVMIDAGLPLVQCLEILGANQENQTFQSALNSIRTTVEGGSTLAARDPPRSSRRRETPRQWGPSSRSSLRRRGAR